MVDEKNPVKSEELSEKGYEILRTAVTKAKTESIGSVALLKARLLAVYPACQVEINEAIAFWASHVRRGRLG